MFQGVPEVPFIIPPLHGGNSVPAMNVELPQFRLDIFMRRVNALIRDHGLLLALRKIEIVVLPKNRIKMLMKSFPNDTMKLFSSKRSL